MVKEKKLKTDVGKQKLKKPAGFYHNDNGVTKIIHFELIKFLGKNGFANMNIGGVTRLVRIVDNIVSDVSEGDLSCFIRNYLISIKEPEVLEAFVRGIGSYLNKKKYELLPKVKGISDKDPKDCAWLYFKNTAVKVTETNIELVPYEKLPHKIWANRIVQKEFNLVNFKNGHFEDFCHKLSKEDPERFKVLKATLGYLLHRYNNPAVTKVVIFLDENATMGGQTNGGTGKSLLSKALSHCVETVLMDGKNMKRDSRFNNQRINNTTDIVCFDDVDRKFSLELLYSMATSGFVIEKKGQNESTLKAEESPKILVSSNFQVLGPGGSSDIRRRHEFELSNYYDQDFTPEVEFGNRFFGTQWDESEWSRFYHFMMDCCKTYLQQGLYQVPHINLLQNKFSDGMAEQFVAFADSYVQNDTTLNKRALFSNFKSLYPEMATTSSHQITKWLQIYAAKKGVTYSSTSSGGYYNFTLTSNKGHNEI
ncbi:primase-helicase family protein [Flavobacterium sp. ACAM 123]|uniref:primase-helicase family protein n=1 Tax=Flavobacterium sp. ACAM 123 TaxID=1189620 RepID=UPI0002ED8C59|nr:primase-helicase family protein [Flavobacterium sp. ACAM 123]